MVVVKLELAISPCPNDTFTFHHLIQSGLDGHVLDLVLADVEELNRRAIEEQCYAISKLSFYTLLKLRKHYNLLSVGAALGRGCGPLLITGKKGADWDQVRRAGRILIPGRWTTANLLLHLFLSDLGLSLADLEFVPERYDRILAQLKTGEEQFGVIIHEERFTFQQQGLIAMQDLGSWWEEQTGLPIPLGGIGLRRDFSESFQTTLEEKIRLSLQMAWQQPGNAREFIRENAQSLEEEVIQAHIALYVNEYSENLGAEGLRAVAELERRMEKAGL